MEIKVTETLKEYHKLGEIKLDFTAYIYSSVNDTTEAISDLEVLFETVREAVAAYCKKYPLPMLINDDDDDE